jgi:hypothetical protein
MRAAILVLITLSLAGVATAEDHPAQPQRITLNLCATDVTSHEWSENLFSNLQEMLEMGKYPKDFKVDFSSTGKPCRKMLIGCDAKPNGEILCGEQSINRLLQASAWLAAHDAQQVIRTHRGMPLKEVLEEVGQMDLFAALQIVDAIDKDDSDKATRFIKAYGLRGDLKDLVTEIQKVETDPNYKSTAGVVLWIAWRTHVIASSELIAVLLGHEFSHAMGGCHLNTRSSVERSGWSEKLVSMQAQGTSFIRKVPSQDEMLADECALRVLEQVDAGFVARDSTLNSSTSRDLAQETVHGGRWIALDAYAELLTNSLSGRTGWNPESQHTGLYQIVGPNLEVGAVDTEGYEDHLYPALRLALAAMTLHERQASDDPRRKIVLCEDTARQFVAMLNIAGDLQKDNKSPEFADLFRAIVPSGVVVGLKTGVWREKYPGWSYACDQ